MHRIRESTIEVNHRYEEGNILSSQPTQTADQQKLERQADR